MTAETPDGWMIDSMAQFMESPDWVVPVQQFIDVHCTLFDTPGTTESRHEFKLAHESFKHLVESILEGFLHELGVPLDAFVQVAAKAAQHREHSHSLLATQVLEYVLALEDYTSFRLMMEKRNVLLDLEVLTALQQPEGSRCVPSPVRDLTDAPAETGRGASATEAWEQLAQVYSDDELFHLAIQASLSEMVAKEREVEDLELQQALRLSEETYRLIQQPGDPLVASTKPEVAIPPSEEPTSPSTTAVAASGACPSVPVQHPPTSHALSALSQHRRSGFQSFRKLPAIPIRTAASVPLAAHPGDAPVPPRDDEALKPVALPPNPTYTPEEVQRRAAYMRAQKERIIQKRIADRQG